MCEVKIIASSDFINSLISVSLLKTWLVFNKSGNLRKTSATKMLMLHICSLIPNSKFYQQI